MSIFVPTSVKTVIDGGHGETTRRVEVYNSDGVTLWQDGLSDRLIDGSVNIAYGDNERRTFDINLNNQDNLLRSEPNGFWYDKIFKIYKGVKFSSYYNNPKVAVIEAANTTVGNQFVAYISSLGFPNSKYLPGALSVGDLLAYDVIISYAGTVVTSTDVSTKLQALYAAGRSVITYSVQNTTTQVPHLGSSSSKTEDWGIQQPLVSTVMSPGWGTFSLGGSNTGTAVTALSGGGLTVARWQMNDASYGITASLVTNNKGGRWVDIHLPNYNSGTSADVNRLIKNIIGWLKNESTLTAWETQIGEFCVDSINSAYFPSNVRVAGRDYTKRCMNSKIESAMSFDAGTPVSVLITALAANAGIVKFNLASMPETIGTSLTFDRGTPRWEVMMQAANTQGYEMYFSQDGYLTTRKYLDPTTSLESNIFQTGVQGNLASIDRSVNDSRLYNHIGVYGDPSSGETRFPYFGEAKNENPASPTRISKIGDRYYSFASSFFTSEQQTQDYADRLLQVHALESFELSFNAISYPWMEAGEIAKVIDPKAVVSDPDKYLVDSATIPLALGPMSFTGKRVTIVG